jgi:hypothetical protein
LYLLIFLFPYARSFFTNVQNLIAAKTASSPVGTPAKIRHNTASKMRGSPLVKRLITAHFFEKFFLVNGDESLERERERERERASSVPSVPILLVFWQKVCFCYAKIVK